MPKRPTRETVNPLPLRPYLPPALALRTRSVKALRTRQGHTSVSASDLERLSQMPSPQNRGGCANTLLRLLPSGSQSDDPELVAHANLEGLVAVAVVDHRQRVAVVERQHQTLAMPALRNTSSNEPVYLLSRSRISKRVPWLMRSRPRLRACWVTEAPWG